MASVLDVEIVADQRHAERGVEALEKHVLGRDATAVVAQERDAVGARDAGASPFLGLLVDETLDPLCVLRPWRPVRFRDQHVAVRQDMEPARMLEPAGERIHRKAAGRGRFGASRPAFGVRDVDRRDRRLGGFRQGGGGPE
jgi:hypothetical protein